MLNISAAASPESRTGQRFIICLSEFAIAQANYTSWPRQFPTYPFKSKPFTSRRYWRRPPNWDLTPPLEKNGSLFWRKSSSEWNRLRTGNLALQPQVFSFVELVIGSSGSTVFSTANREYLLAKRRSKGLQVLRINCIRAFSSSVQRKRPSRSSPAISSARERLLDVDSPSKDFFNTSNANMHSFADLSRKCQVHR